MSSVLERLLALEKLMMGSPERERLKLLKTVAESRKEIQARPLGAAESRAHTHRHTHTLGAH